MFNRLIVLAVCLLGASAHGKPATRDGFFLQFNIGPATQTWSLDDPAPGLSNMTVEGSGAQFDVAIGGNISENFSIFGQISSASAFGPTVTFEGGGLSASGTTDQDVNASTVGYGVGVQYAFMPLNLYVAATFLSMQLQIEIDGDRRGSEIGSGGMLRVGKEWWVSDEWNLGVALHFIGGSIPDEDNSEDWSVSNAGLTFSATFN